MTSETNPVSGRVGTTGASSSSSSSSWPTLKAEETTSTMDLARQVPFYDGHDTLPTPFAVIARHQLKGRGRGGAVWTQAETASEKGADGAAHGDAPPDQTESTAAEPRQGPLTLSPSLAEALAGEVDMLPMTVVFAQKDIAISMGWLTAALGAALVDALDSLTRFFLSAYPGLGRFVAPVDWGSGHEHSDVAAGQGARLFRIKWPNDIVVLSRPAARAESRAESKAAERREAPAEFRKLAGILCEAYSQAAQFDRIYAGLGINLTRAPGQVETATSFLGALFDARGHASAAGAAAAPETRGLARELQRFERAGGREVLVREFGVFLEREINEYVRVPRTPEQLRDLVLERSIPIGTRLVANKGRSRGRFAGLDLEGGLLLEGVAAPIFAGEVQFESGVRTPAASRATPAGATRNEGARKQGALLPRKKAPEKADSTETPKPPPDPAQKPRLVPFALDLGNTRAHFLLGKEDGTLVRGDVDYDVFGPGAAAAGPSPAPERREQQGARAALRPVLEVLAKQRSALVHVPFVSVTSDQRRTSFLDELSRYLKSLLPELRVAPQAISAQDILASQGLADQYAPGELGADRALRFAFAVREARRRGCPVATLGLGTVTTLELADGKGRLLDSWLMPGLGLWFETLHARTARLPLVAWDAHALERAAVARDPSLGAAGDAAAGPPFDTRETMLRGAVLALAGALRESISKAGARVLFLSGGNAETVRGGIARALEGIEIELATSTTLELEMLLSVSREANPDALLRAPLGPVPGAGERPALLGADRPPSTSDGGRLESSQASAVSPAAQADPANEFPLNFKSRSAQGVIRSLIRARAAQRNRTAEGPSSESLPPDDFRRLGGRIESVGVGERFDKYLSARFPFHSRELWRDRILSKEVLVEQNSPKQGTQDLPSSALAAKHTYRIRPFDQIWLYHPKDHEPDFLDLQDPVFDDGDTAIFAKPPNLVIHAAGLYGKNTFVHLARKRGFGDCAPIHRIDRETSGALVCARSTRTRTELSLAFRQGQMKKLYLAVSASAPQHEDDPLPESFRVELPIGHAISSRIRLKLWVDGPDSVPALTCFRRLASHEGFTLFACLPKTGRTNQIRIHLAAIGQCIVGDKMYFPDEDVFLKFYDEGLTPEVLERIRFPRHLLHNLGIQGPPTLASALGGAPQICPLAHDMLEFEPLRILMERAGLPTDDDAQKEVFRDLFEELHAFDFSQAPVIGLQVKS